MEDIKYSRLKGKAVCTLLLNKYGLGRFNELPDSQIAKMLEDGFDAGYHAGASSVDWIPVSVALPADSDKYLCCLDGFNRDGDLIGQFVAVLHFNSDTQTWTDKIGDTNDYADVKAWIKLPTVYKLET